MVAQNNATLTLEAGDVAGGRNVRLHDVSTDQTVGELIGDLLPRMNLLDRVDGRPVTYSARLEREGRNLFASERVADALQPDDRIVLAPSITAG